MNEQNQPSAGKNPEYDRYRPSMYTRRVPIFWWVKKGSYVHFIVRELTSLSVAAYAVLMIVQLIALKDGPAAYEALLAWFQTPLSITIHLVILGCTLFHSITWFKLAPAAMVLRFRGKRIPDAAIVTVNLVMWGVLSIVVAWFILAA